MRQAKFHIGAIVRHRIYPFRGVVFDVEQSTDRQHATSDTQQVHAQ